MPPITYPSDSFTNIEQGLEPRMAYPIQQGQQDAVKAIYEVQPAAPGTYAYEDKLKKLRKLFFVDLPEQTGDTPPTAAQWYDEIARSQRRIGTPGLSFWREGPMRIFLRFQHLLELSGAITPIKVDGRAVATMPRNPAQAAAEMQEVSSAMKAIGFAGQAFPEEFKMYVDGEKTQLALFDKMRVTGNFVKMRDSNAVKQAIGRDRPASSRAQAVKRGAGSRRRRSATGRGASMIEDKRFHASIDAIARTDDGRLLYLFLQKRLMGVPTAISDGALYSDLGERTFAAKLIGLMAKGIAESGGRNDKSEHRQPDEQPIVFAVRRPVAVADRHGAKRRVNADTVVPGRLERRPIKVRSLRARNGCRKNSTMPTRTRSKAPICARTSTNSRPSRPLRIPAAPRCRPTPGSLRTEAFRKPSRAPEGASTSRSTPTTPCSSPRAKWHTPRAGRNPISPTRSASSPP